MGAKTKRILIHAPDFNHGRLFDPALRDNTADLNICIRDAIQARGYEVLTSDDHPVDGCDWIIFYDVPVPVASGVPRVRRRVRELVSGPVERDLYREAIAAGLVDRCALILWEPRSTQPINWKPSTHALFRYIFTWNDTFVDGVRYHKFNIPQVRDYPVLPPQQDPS